jgi:hypothetical protein
VSGRRAGLVAGIVAGAMTLGACGVPITGSPSALSKSALPPVLGAPTTTSSPPAAYLPFVIFFISPTNNTLVPVQRGAAPRSNNLRTAITALLAGPVAPKEIQEGLFNPLQSVQLIGVSPNLVLNASAAPSGPITVDLSLDFLPISGVNQVLAVEQVVFTVACNVASASLAPSVRVSFEVTGTNQPVPLPNGATTDAPVTPSDYLNGQPLSCQPSS